MLKDEIAHKEWVVGIFLSLWRGKKETFERETGKVNAYTPNYVLLDKKQKKHSLLQD